MEIKNKGFTLVELIVVITILAILGTIAFISFQGYSRDSRNSVRISDLNVMKKSLELFKTSNSHYPTLSTGTVINYKGYEAWTQGLFSSDIIKNLNSISNIPLDPLSSLEYTYSVTNSKNEYQIGLMIEDDTIGFLDYNKANAVNKNAKAMVTGNYNGKVLKVNGGGIIYVLSVPSLISSDLTDGDLVTIINSKKLIYDHFHNLPDNYKNSSLNDSVGSDLLLVNTASLELFSGSIDLLKDENNQIKLIENIQAAYNDTEIVNEDQIKEILSYDVVNNPEGAKYISQLIINQNISSDVKVTSENVVLDDTLEQSISGLSGEDQCLSLLTESDKNELNTFFTGTSHNGDISYWCSLGVINVRDINIGKQIPASIGKLRNVYAIQLRNVGLIGTIPNEITKLSNLMYLWISYNSNLTGSIPSSIGNLTSLEDIWFGYNNLTGTIPYSIGNLSELQYLAIEDNSITGSIPLSILNLTKLKEIYFNFNNLTGSIPDSIGNFNNLTLLYLNNNTLTGSIPSSIGNLTNLKWLALGNNSLTGSIPSSIGNLTNLEWLSVNNNSLTGIIPSSIGNLQNIQELYLGANGLTGSIPSTIGNLQNLLHFTLGFNQLTGSIPSTIGNLVNLKSIDLGENPLTGIIPPELGNLSNLEELYIGNDPIQLTGTIPPELGNLSKLKIMSFRQNGLTGSIPPELGNLSNLTDLYLNHNNLTGSIPPQLGNLSNLKEIRISNNNLTGSIPKELGNLSNLESLGLKVNKLSGTIPTELGNLSKLGLDDGEVYIFQNNLTGAGIGFCNLIKNATRNWNSPDSIENNNSYGEYRDNPQDTDNDGSYDDTINLCP